MNVINTTVLRNNLATSMKSVAEKRDYLLIANKGKITSALVDIDFLEDLISMTNNKYKKSIKKARDEYEKGNVMRHDEVFGEL